MSRKQYQTYDEQGEQGFERAQALIEQPFTIIKNEDREETLYNTSNKHVFNKQRAHYLIKQKPKIKFGLLQMLPLTSRKKGDSEKYIKSLSLHKSMFEESQKPQMMMKQQRRAMKQEQRKKKGLSLEEIINTAIIKTKRNQIGQELVIKTDQNAQIVQLRSNQSIGKPIFKKKNYGTTHQLLRQLSKYSSSSFINSKYNSILKSKLQRAQTKNELTSKFETSSIKFEANMQSSNLNYVTQLAQDEYNLFLSVDTNTRGHQNWFYFAVTNNEPTAKTIRINICNMKRKFPMIKHGQGIYKKSPNRQWQFIPQVTIERSDKKKYKLSFLLSLKELQKVQVSLIPPYTYSDMLREVQSFQTCSNVRVDTLTYSLAGLAIPLITITKGASHSNHNFKNRKLYLITARIHPSQTCSSYIASALIKQLISNADYEQFLKQNVVKIVPMVNPDGVVFGNFRTNYLGVDLNRSFHYNDQLIYPETVAVKQLGKKYKQQYGSNFVSFLDLHGHSSQASSFIYGPQYGQGTQNYMECRIFAKIIDRKSNYFRYDFSSFRLEEYKFNTARGFFFKKLKVPSYTIETSYSLYSRKDTEQKIYEQLGISQWQELGRSLASSLKINYQCFFITQEQKEINKQQTIQKDIKKKRIQSINKIQHNPVFQKFVQDKSIYLKLKKQIMQQIKNQKINKAQNNKDQESESESDGQSIEQDFAPQERQLLIHSLSSTLTGRSLFPKITKQSRQTKQQKQQKQLRESKQTIATSPLAIPTLYVGNQKAAQLGVLQKISSKFKNKRYNRPVSISQQYTDYLLRNITGISSLRPEVVNFNPKIYKPSHLKLSNQS